MTTEEKLKIIKGWCYRCEIQRHPSNGTWYCRIVLTGGTVNPRYTNMFKSQDGAINESYGIVKTWALTTCREITEIL